MSAHQDNLVSIWEKFTLQSANPNQDFFESGGDSLGAINMIVEIQKLYEVEISLEKFMRNPTLSFLIENTQSRSNHG